MTLTPGTREKHGKSWLGYKGHFTETVSDPAGDDPHTGRPRSEPGHRSPRPPTPPSRTW